MSTTFSRHAEQAHDLVADVLAGKDTVTEAQRKTALAVLNGDIKERQTVSGKAARVIGLVKHVRTAEVREEIALHALAELLPRLASGEVMTPTRAALAGETPQALAGDPEAQPEAVAG